MSNVQPAGKSIFAGGKGGGKGRGAKGRKGRSRGRSRY